jgi:hypothetical protein
MGYGNKHYKYMKLFINHFYGKQDNMIALRKCSLSFGLMATVNEPLKLVSEFGMEIDHKGTCQILYLSQ